MAPVLTAGPGTELTVPGWHCLPTHGGVTWVAALPPPELCGCHCPLSPTGGISRCPEGARQSLGSGEGVGPTALDARKLDPGLSPAAGSPVTTTLAHGARGVPYPAPTLPFCWEAAFLGTIGPGRPAEG